MNKNLHSSTALTEFARDFDEEPKTLFTKIVDKITTGIYNTGSSAGLPKTETFDGETSDVIVKVVIHDPEAENHRTSDDVSNQIRNNMSISSEECPLEINISQGRTSINVLKQLINLVSQKPTVSNHCYSVVPVFERFFFSFLTIDGGIGGTGMQKFHCILSK